MTRIRVTNTGLIIKKPDVMKKSIYAVFFLILALSFGCEKEQDAIQDAGGVTIKNTVKVGTTVVPMDVKVKNKTTGEYLIDGWARLNANETVGFHNLAAGQYELEMKRPYISGSSTPTTNPELFPTVINTITIVEGEWLTYAMSFTIPLPVK